MAELNQRKCSSCGANLSYDRKQHKYVCDYCKSIFVDTKDNGSANPRVELTPDDLKKIGTDFESNAHKHVNVISLVVIVISILTFVFPLIIFSIISMSIF